MDVNLKISENIQNAIVDFSSEIRNKLKNNILDIRLFGSVAKGNNTPESDIDILVLLKKKDSNIQRLIFDMAFEVSLKYDVVISPILKSEREYNFPLFQKTLFYRNLKEEGLSL